MKKIGIAVALAILFSIGIFNYRVKAESIDIAGKSKVVTEAGTAVEGRFHIVHNEILQETKAVVRENFVLRLWQKTDTWRKVIVAVGILVVAAFIVLIVSLAGKHKRKTKSKYNPYFDENGNEITDTSTEQTVSWRQSGFGDIIDVAEVETKDPGKADNTFFPEAAEDIPSGIPVMEEVKAEDSRKTIPSVNEAFDAQSAVASAARSATVYSMGLETEDSDITPVSPEDFYNQLSERTGEFFGKDSVPASHPEEETVIEPENLSILEEAAAAHVWQTTSDYIPPMEQISQDEMNTVQREEDIANALYSDDLISTVAEEGAAYSDLYSDEMVSAIIFSGESEEPKNPEAAEEIQYYEEPQPVDGILYDENSQYMEGPQYFGEQQYTEELQYVEGTQYADEMHLSQGDAYVTKTEEDEVYPEDFEALLNMELSAAETAAMDNILDDLLIDGADESELYGDETESEYAPQPFDADGEEGLSTEESLEMESFLEGVFAIETDAPSMEEEAPHMSDAIAYEWTEYDPYLPREYREIPEEEFLAAQLDANEKTEPMSESLNANNGDMDDPLPRDDEFFGFIKKFREEKKEKAEITEAEITIEEKIDKLFHEGL